MRITLFGIACLAFSAAHASAQNQPQSSSDSTRPDLGVDHATLVGRLKPAYECKEDAPTASTTCTRQGVTVVVQGAGRARSVTFMFSLDNDKQLAEGSVTMVALAKDVFGEWKFGKWYERHLKQARRLGAKVAHDGIQISASAFGKAKARLLVVWTIVQAPVQ